ncbi:MAG TPA: hypothetical protein VGK00_06200 [Anaerolineales bacterium]
MSIHRKLKKVTSNSVEIFAGRRFVGRVTGDVFSKTIEGSKHIMKDPPALFWDVQALKDAEAVGAEVVEVKDRESGNVYTARIATIWQKPIYKNYGYGDQVGLRLSEFTVNGKPPRTVKPTSQVEKKSQFRLW